MNLLLPLWIAETRKLFSRLSAKVGLLAAVGVGALGPVGLWFLASAGITVNGGDLGASLDVAAPNGWRWGLFVRNFFVAQGFLALLGSLALAGELQARTLREDLVRPVPRAAVLLAKWGALATFAAAWGLAQSGASVVVGLVLLPATGQVAWGTVGLATLASFAADLSFAAAALAVAAVLRSPTSSLLGLLLFAVIERFVTLGLWVLRGWLLASPELSDGVRWTMHAVPLLPSSAWGVWWDVVNAQPPIWASWGALLGWTALAVTVAIGAFQRTDVP